MIVHDVEQGTAAWHRLRLGIPTASNFSKILTKGGKPSTQAERYMRELLAEHFIGEPANSGASAFMERGTAMEKSARAWYEHTRDVDVKQVGFITRDDGMAGASPDGLVGEDGMLELKVPSAAVHIAYLLGGFDGEYWTQAQGQLYIAERKWVDLVAYNPVLPPAIERIERDEDYIELLDAAVKAFVVEMLAARKRLLAVGCKQATRLLIPASMVTDPEPF